MNKQEVIEKIKAAFREETYPHESPLFIPSGGHVFDIDEAVAELKFEKWDEIPLQALIRNRHRMTYLTGQGFRFLLPAFLIAAINHPREVDMLKDTLVFMLIPPPSNTIARRDFEKIAALLSTAQAEAILHFFESYTEIYPVNEWSFDKKDEVQVNKAILFWRER